MPQGNLVEVVGREVRQGSPRELMVESSSSRQRRPPCKTNKEMSDKATDAAALTYLLTLLNDGKHTNHAVQASRVCFHPSCIMFSPGPFHEYNSRQVKWHAKGVPFYRPMERCTVGVLALISLSKSRLPTTDCHCSL